MTFFPSRIQEAVEVVPGTSPIVGNRVELQLLTTLTCNLKCTYCSLGVGDMVGSQGEVSYSTDALDAFIKKHLSEHEVYVTFYGGEPTLNLDFIKEIMARYPTFRFQLQTNGTLLDGLPAFHRRRRGDHRRFPRARCVQAGGQEHPSGARQDEGQLHGARDLE